MSENTRTSSVSEKAFIFSYSICISLLPARECDNVTTRYYPISVLSSVKWSLTGGWKQKKISNFYQLEKWSRPLTRVGRLQEVPSIVIWLGNVWHFGRLVAEVGWSLTRSGCKWMFDCIQDFRFCLSQKNESKMHALQWQDHSSSLDLNQEMIKAIFSAIYWKCANRTDD